MAIARCHSGTLCNRLSSIPPTFARLLVIDDDDDRCTVVEIVVDLGGVPTHVA